MKILNTAAAIALLAATATASALTIDTDIYFAYATSRDRTITLSHRPCENPKFSKDGWKKAHYYFSRGDGVPSCWKPFPDSTMEVCWVNPDHSQSLHNCMLASKGKFLNTSSLPSNAKF